MNSEIKRKWTATLRSGEVEQGQGKLRDGDKFCCLGVLCELHRKAHPGKKWNDRLSYLGSSAMLPVEVQQWAELTESDPSVTSPADTKTRTNLSVLNDTWRTFAEIADIIEAQL